MANETRTESLRPAAAQDVKDALCYALRYSGRRRQHDADELMSHIVAQRLVEHLDRCGFVLMRHPPATAPTTARHTHPNDPQPRRKATEP